MDRRKLDKNDISLVKARAKELSREVGSDAVKESLAAFKKGVPFGYFDEFGNLMAWKVVDPSTKKVISSCGVPKKGATTGIAAVPEEEPALPKVNPRHYGEEQLTRVQAAPDDLSYIDEAYDYPLSQDESMLYLSDEDDLTMMDREEDIMEAVAPVYNVGKTRVKETPELTATVVPVSTSGKEKKKRNPIVTVIVVLIVLAILGAAGFVAYKFAGGLLQNILPNQEQPQDDAPDYDSYSQISVNDIVHVQVTSGNTVKDIRQKLCEAGLPNIAREFVDTATNMGADASIQAGDYIVRGDESATDIIKRMVECDRVPDGVIGVNEGDDINDIVATVTNAKIKFDPVALSGELHNPYAFVGEYSMLTALPEGLPSLEGYIPTGEFNLYSCESAHNAVKVLLDPMQVRFEQSGMEPRAWFDVLTKASLIEKEAMFDEDRPLIASVIENRLAANMELQIDASIKYATGSEDAQVMYGQLEVDSPYNTYTHVGLPIGPICSGISEASIMAVINAPQNPTNFMFYVLADREGHHKFSTTLEEFTADKQAYLDMYGYEDSW